MTNFKRIFPECATEESDIEHDRFVDEYLDPLQPVVIRGAVNDWPAVGKWDPTFVRDAIGEESIDAAHNGKRYRVHGEQSGGSCSASYRRSARC